MLSFVYKSVLAERQRKYRAFFLKNGAAWAKLDEGFFIS